MDRNMVSNARRLWARWFTLGFILNVYLLRIAIRRWHYPLPPLSHAAAQVFFWAIAVNVVFELLVGWYAIREGWQERLSLVLKLDAAITLIPFLMGKFYWVEGEIAFRIFGTLYAVFLLLRLSLGIAWAAWNLPGTQRVRRSGIYVFAVAFIVFTGFVPWIWLGGPPIGDESAYMLLAHSLAFDHDFDVGDNYRNHDHVEQFPPPPPGTLRGYPYAFMQRDGIEYLPHEPHVITNFRGQQMLWHDVGLSLLIAPAYRIAKREGALFVMAVLAALGAAAVFEISIRLGATNLQALLTAAIFCFTPPFYLYAQAVLVEGAGAVGILWAALQFFRYRERPRNRYLLLAGIVIAALPWLIIRFWALAGPLFLVFVAWVCVHEWHAWRRLVTKLALLSLPCLVSLGAFAILDKRLFNTYLPNAGMLILRRSLPQFGGNPVLGFLGVMFDQSWGLMPTAPMYLAVAAGMIVLLGRDRWGFAALFLPALGYLPFIVFSRFWTGGWNPPARYLLVAAMAMVPGASLVLTRKTLWIATLLTAWSGLLSVAYTIDPYLRMPSIWHLYRKSMLVEELHDHIPTPFYSIFSIFPDLLTASRSDWFRAWIWAAFTAGAAWLWARSAERNQVT